MVDRAADAAPPVWFISGCSSGFGRELARLALSRGYPTVVTARDPARVQALADGHGDRCLVLPLDVTDRGQIAAAVAQAEQRYGAIDVLVNNAGRGFMVPVEEADEAEVRKLFELNYFGLVALTRAVLPGMRQRGRGHVVNISSTGGLIGRAGSGYYAATKFAVEGLSEALAQEVEPYGIKVTIVEPGPFRTGFVAALHREPTIVYGATAGARTQQVVDADGSQAGDPARAAQAIVTAVEAPHPPLHLPLGKPAIAVARAKFTAILKEIDTWEALSASADYPPPGG
ncbi:MAG: oxidoreductase [Lautropia sp.]